MLDASVPVAALPGDENELSLLPPRGRPRIYGEPLESDNNAYLPLASRSYAFRVQAKNHQPAAAPIPKAPINTRVSMKWKPVVGTFNQKPGSE